MLIGNGSGFDSPVSVSNEFCVESSDSYRSFHYNPRKIGDIDGDGKDDIIAFSENTYVAYGILILILIF